MPCFPGNRRRRRSEEVMMFEDSFTRRIFISKVLMIVAINLLITVALMTFCIFHLGTRRFLLKHWYLPLIAAGVLMIFSFMICCCANCFRRSPQKWILLVIYVLCHALLVSCLAVRFHPKLVFIAASACALIVVLLGLFARFAPCDFTGCWILALVFGLVVMVMGIVAIFIPSFKIVYVSFGVLLFCFYIVIDLQMLIGGKTHRNQFDESDYILAAMFIYSDIIFLFIYLLELIGLIDS
ncbi:protein lifeguard 3 [Drosophila ficusphila]|uniref:protein lifeguard 3 n=1 Tax=Drosophila ficusphila TaxID=30025 RepID=UPI0007E5DF11|nr:protein lifeguard 3 [Drosophila ficusphila]